MFLLRYSICSEEEEVFRKKPMGFGLAVNDHILAVQYHQAWLVFCFVVLREEAKHISLQATKLMLFGGWFSILTSLFR